VQNATSTPGVKLGPIQFAPGVTPLNAGAFLYSSFVAIVLFSFLSFAQPYVLTEIVRVPPEEAGRLTGLLVTMQEIISLCLVGYIGGLSDRFGRRTLYALGFCVMGVGYVLFPYADSTADLFAYRFIYALGIAMSGVMFAVISVDYPAERSRGKLGGTTGLLNGLGIALGALAFSQLPAWFQARGDSSAEAARDMLLVVGALSFVTAAVVGFGLKKGTPGQKRKQVSIAETFRIGIGHGLANRRILLCFAGGFISRADLTLVATFISLWLQQAARNEGLTGAEAIARAGMIFGIIQGSSLLWAPISGVLIDRFDRLLCVVASLLVAGIGYLFLGLQEHPFAAPGILGAVLVGIGQMSVIQSSQSLLGQETPVEARGAVVGLSAFCGAAGILTTSLVSGYLYDHWMISGPVVFVGLANLAVFTFALATWLADGRPQRFDPKVIPASRAAEMPAGH
jgi:MFS family permease